ncbi:MAG: sensor histidine kinase [Candidatus Thiodiazotropha sp.]
MEYKSLSSPSAITEEAERKRLSRELHDGLGQLLTTIGLQVNQCINGFEGNQDSGQPISKHKASLEQLSLLVQEAIGEVRSLCCAIRPAILDDLGILAAISWQCRQISRAAPELVMVTSFNIEEEQIPVAYRSAIYRIVQESLNNAVKYAQASRIRISLRLEDESIHLSIVDNGIGFDLSKIQQKLGIGLMSMRERAASIQGKLEIDTSSGTGVEIRAQFPIEAMAG